ncbi:hypothetical protein CCP2SC5_50078 [Azospirillaceae bacterium]
MDTLRRFGFENPSEFATVSGWHEGDIVQLGVLVRATFVGYLLFLICQSLSS